MLECKRELKLTEQHGQWTILVNSVQNINKMVCLPVSTYTRAVKFESLFKSKIILARFLDFKLSMKCATTASNLNIKINLFKCQRCTTYISRQYLLV